MKKFIAVLTIIACLVPAFAVEGWQNFVVPFPIRDADATEDGVWLATDGGLRYRTADADNVYSPANGLEDAVFHGVINTPKGVFAVSEFGMIARLRDDFSGWKVINRSFLSAKERIIPGMVEFAEKYLVIAFENKIAIFDVESASSILSIDRIGDVVLSIYGPQKIEIRKDSLFVETIRGTLARKMDWEHLASDMRLVDPETWSRVEGVCLHCEEAALKMPDGKTLTDPLLFYDGKSLVKWRFDRGKRTFLVGYNLVAVYEDGKLTDLTNHVRFQLDGAYEIQSVPGGGVIALSTDGRLSANLKGFWYEPTILLSGNGSGEASYSYRLKTLSVQSKDRLVLHIWGLGFLMLQSGGYFPVEYVMPWDVPCLDWFTDSITISLGTTVAPDGSGFLLTTSAKKSPYSVDYFSNDGELSCGTGVGSTSFAGPIVARMADNGSDWIAYVSNRDGNFGAFASGGIDIITFPSPARNGGRIVNPQRKSVAGLEGKTPVDMAIDHEHKVLWLVTATGVGYMEFDEDTIRKPVSMNGLVGAEYTSIAVDPLGNVWVGTTMQGAFRLSPQGKTFDTLSVMHFTQKDGLLNNAINDLTIDEALGTIWFAHDNGTSLYQRNDLRRPRTVESDSTKAEIKAYPVPFRPGIQPFVRIDNISADARVDIYNRGGSLVRSFVGDDVAGGMVEWDGTSKNGRLAAPGVYYYVVRTHSKTHKGKFIVIH